MRTASRCVGADAQIVPTLRPGAQVKLRVFVCASESRAIVATFDKPGDYVWHCHILSHEDNEMMRPYTVVSDFDLFV